jgi:hypothetical protein
MESKKGGCGFFHRKDLHDYITIDEELSIFEEGFFESLFLKVRNGTSRKGKNTIIGTTYLPTGQRTNQARIYEHFESITQKIESRKCNCILVGDTNIILMKYGTDEQVGEYVDHFVSNTFKFRLAQPTRVSHSSATLLDHVIDNLERAQVATSGILTKQLYGASGWTDHFPTHSCQMPHIQGQHSNNEDKKTHQPNHNAKLQTEASPRRLLQCLHGKP